ncbi:CLUMA_CG009043, isoform A [Clunio marinus]|uniref:CLUMA_CG009043, isoform A n=1 Tax=Clunio marinus TaxID=568069 RepID=A0A1J1I9D7_9DIPT|nr:CLUMA_CG009043, isoform A [Clunio marinus]
MSESLFSEIIAYHEKKDNKLFVTSNSEYLINSHDCFIQEGNFGVCIRGLERKLGTKKRTWTQTEVGVKIIKVRDEPNLSHEYEIIKKCQGHPNIVDVKDYFKNEKFEYLVMEYLEGGDLFEFINRQKCYLEEQAVKLYFRQILEGVKFIHSKDILHNDLKAENVGFKNGQLKIIDFGSATSQEEILNNFTLPYASPEILKGKKCSVLSDVWSLGVLLCFMLYGELPFGIPEDNEEEERHKISTLIKTGKMLVKLDSENISSEANSLMKKMLCNTLSKRLSINEIFNHTWMHQDQSKIKENIAVPSSNIISEKRTRRPPNRLRETPEFQSIFKKPTQKKPRKN